MSTPRFFHEEEAGRLLLRASRAAACPLSVHYAADGDETVHVFGTRGCAVCRGVGEAEGGHAACRAVRAAARTDAWARDRAEVFLCHMGLTCVAAPAGLDAPYFLTFGPFRPDEVSVESMAHGVRTGFAALGVHLDTEEPAAFDDIRSVPPEAVAEVAEWTRDGLRALAAAGRTSLDDEDAGETPAENPGARRRLRPFISTPYEASAIAAALVAGDRNRARALVRAALAEASTGERPHVAALRGRAIGIVGAVLEACALTGADAGECFDAFGGFVKGVCSVRTRKELENAAMALLAPPRRVPPRPETDQGRQQALHEFLDGRLAQGVTLEEVAAHLGQNPTAVTHWLQRKFGMSYSQYVGRMRVDAAKELLRRTGLGSGEIARRVGIADVSNFGKLFRKFEHISPSEYRRRHGRRV